MEVSQTEELKISEKNSVGNIKIQGQEGMAPCAHMNGDDIVQLRAKKGKEMPYDFLEILRSLAEYH